MTMWRAIIDDTIQVDGLAAPSLPGGTLDLIEARMRGVGHADLVIVSGTHVDPRTSPHPQRRDAIVTRTAAGLGVSLSGSGSTRHLSGLSEDEAIEAAVLWCALGTIVTPVA